MTGTCGCNHPHLPGMTHCYLCCLPIDVPPAVEDAASPRSAPVPPAGGTQAVREQLFSQLMINPETGCLLWTGYINEHGYGRTWVGGRAGSKKYVHRLAWELLNGPIPDGLQLDHLCRVRHCANVAHLEPVTNRVNALRGDTITAAHADKTHCDQGHEFDLLNTYWRPSGGRICRTCQRAAERRYRDKRRRVGP